MVSGWWTSREQAPHVAFSCALVMFVGGICDLRFFNGKNNKGCLAASVLGAGSGSRGYGFEPHVAGRESLKIES